MPTTDRTYDEAAIRAEMRAGVLAGVAKLDDVLGPDWILMVEPTKLRMDSIPVCVIGQLNRTTAGNAFVRPDDGRSVTRHWIEETGRMYPPSLGFELSQFALDSPYSVETLYAWLTDIWQRELWRLRAERTIAVNARRCSYDPKPLLGQPIGMFHCPECGCMVVAGLDHGACLPNLCPMLDARGNGDHPGAVEQVSIPRRVAMQLGLIEQDDEAATS
jgi:hypothetical protein